jgi:hypothetical protein
MGARLGRVALAVLLGAASMAAVPVAVAAQEMEAEVGGEERRSVRLAARLLADGRTEFGLQLQSPDGRWGTRQLPRARFVAAGAAVGGWLASSPVTVNISPRLDLDPTGEIELRIAARRADDGRIEFALQQRRADGSWGGRLLPARRNFPATATVGRWLTSTPVTVTAWRSDATGFALGGRSRSADTLLASNFDRTCAVQLDGGVTCWGHNGLRERLSTTGLDGVVAVTVGAHANAASHTCVLHDDGTVSCWGPGGEGQLGQGSDQRLHVPARVPGISDAVAVAAAGYYTCALHADGGVSCWGLGYGGQFGDGTGRSGPQRIAGISDAATIAAGYTDTCAVHFDGTVSCWDSGGSRSGPPALRKVPGIRGATSVAIGWGRFCAVTAGGTVHCWENSIPIFVERVRDLEDVAMVSVGVDNFCALHTDGGVSCWGDRNNSGELGDGSTEPRSQPRRLRDIGDAVAITAGVDSSLHFSGREKEIESHACAMHRDGSVSCWGNNRFGQLGDGTFETRLVPTAVGDFDEYDPAGPPANGTQFLRTWLDAVVAEHEDRFPWLRAAWDHARPRSALAELGVGGAVSHSCHVSTPPLRCAVSSFELLEADLGIAVHELAHVYDIHTGLAPSRAWGAAQLYFAVRMSECTPQFDRSDADVELLADALLHPVVPNNYLLYYEFFECPESADALSREAQQVLRDALAGRVPAWYTRNITNGAELWTALRTDFSLRILANLQDEFGGLCSFDWIPEWRLEGGPLPPEGANPFRDGGC